MAAVAIEPPVLPERRAGWNGDDIGCVLGTDRFRLAERRVLLDRFSLATLIRFLTPLALCVAAHV